MHDFWKTFSTQLLSARSRDMLADEANEYLNKDMSRLGVVVFTCHAKVALMKERVHTAWKNEATGIDYAVVNINAESCAEYKHKLILYLDARCDKTALFVFAGKRAQETVPESLKHEYVFINCINYESSLENNRIFKLAYELAETNRVLGALLSR